MRPMVWRNGTPLRTSGESEAETKRPPINKKNPTSRKILHLVQILHVVGMDLHQMQVFVLSFPFVFDVKVYSSDICYSNNEDHH